MGVMRQRLPLPDDCPPCLRALIEECWQEEPALRPAFSSIRERLAAELARVDEGARGECRPASQSIGGSGLGGEAAVAAAGGGEADAVAGIEPGNVGSSMSRTTSSGCGSESRDHTLHTAV